MSTSRVAHDPSAPDYRGTSPASPGRKGKTAGGTAGVAVSADEQPTRLRDRPQAARRTAAEYDRIPYRSLPYPLTRPAHIAAIAQTFGLAVPRGDDGTRARDRLRRRRQHHSAGGRVSHARFVGIDLSAVQIAQARVFLEFLKEHTPEDTPYGQVVRREATILADQSDDYVMHEFLEREEQPCTVVEFVTDGRDGGPRPPGRRRHQTHAAGEDAARRRPRGCASSPPRPCSSSTISTW